MCTPSNFVPRRSTRIRSARFLVLTICAAAGMPAPMNAQPRYTIAYSGFAPFLASPAQDFAALYGSADIYRAHPDGARLERLTDDPSFHDQAAVGRSHRQLPLWWMRGPQRLPECHPKRDAPARTWNRSRRRAACLPFRVESHSGRRGSLANDIFDIWTRVHRDCMGREHSLVCSRGPPDGR